MLSAHERSVCGIFLFSGSHINRDKNTYGNIQLIIYIPLSLVKGTCELNEKNIGHMLLREGTRCNFCLDYGLHGNKVDSSAIKLARLVSLRQVMQISCLECLEVSLTISLKRSCWMLPFINLFASNRPVFFIKANCCKILLSNVTAQVKHNSVEYVLERNTPAVIVTTEFLASAIAKYLV